MDPMYLNVVVNLAEALLGVGLILCLVRLILGPSVPDRVVALDLSSTLVVGIIALETLASNQDLFLRIAVVITMLSFLGTVSFANYIAKGGQQ